MLGYNVIMLAQSPKNLFLDIWVIEKKKKLQHITRLVTFQMPRSVVLKFVSAVYAGFLF